MALHVVTGGAGFIGSHLVERLIAEGVRVRVVDDLSTGKARNLAAVAGQIELITGSVTDRGLLRRVLQGAEVVYHLAAIPSVQRSVEDPETTHLVCATGTLLVLQAARQAGVRRVVYAASSSAYGGTPGAVRRESDPLDPLSPYAAAKLAGEHYCCAFSTVYGLETVRLRFFNIFGPRQDASSPYSGVIALFMHAMLQGKSPTVHGDGLQSRDFTYVDNAVEACWCASRASGVSGRVYNIGSGARTSILQLVAALNELLGTRLGPVHGPPRPGDVRHSQADISRACTELGYKPRIDFHEGLRRTLEWYRAELAR
ncbi:MAG: LPS biosynthesis protein WbpP [Gemmataceae bacterium]